MLDKNDSGSGSKSNANRFHGKHDYFRAPTSGLEDMVFQPHSSAVQFKKNNDRMANHVKVTFKKMVPTMGKALVKLVQSVLSVPSMPDSDLKLYDADIILFAETYKLANQDIREFKDANQRSYNLYKHHCAEAMMKKMATLPDWDTVEEDMDGVGLAKILRQVCHKKGAGGKQQMLNIVQATKDAFM